MNKPVTAPYLPHPVSDTYSLAYHLATSVLGWRYAAIHADVPIANHSQPVFSAEKVGQVLVELWKKLVPPEHRPELKVWCGKVPFILPSGSALVWPPGFSCQHVLAKMTDHG